MPTLLLSLAMLVLAVLPAPAAPPAIVALGDSLTAGYGLAQGEDFADRLEAALAAQGIDCQGRPMPASPATRHRPAPPGSTGRCQEEPSCVIVELGANDALRGIDPAINAPGACRSFWPG